MNNKLMKGEEASQTQFWWAPDGMERRALAEQLWLGVKSASSLQPMAGCKPVLSFHSAQPAWNPTGCGLYFTLLACGSFTANQVEHLPAPRTKALKISPRTSTSRPGTGQGNEGKLIKPQALKDLLTTDTTKSFVLALFKIQLCCPKTTKKLTN